MNKENEANKLLIDAHYAWFVPHTLVALRICVSFVFAFVLIFLLMQKEKDKLNITVLGIDKKYPVLNYIYYAARTLDIDFMKTVFKYCEYNCYD